MFDVHKNESKDLFVPSQEVRESIHQLDEKEYVEDELDDEQREVMEEIWLKADEMGTSIQIILIYNFFITNLFIFLDVSEVSYNNGSSRQSKKNNKLTDNTDFSSDSDYSIKSDLRNGKKKKSKKKDTKKKNSKSKKVKTIHKPKVIEKRNEKIVNHSLVLPNNLETDESQIQQVNQKMEITLSPITPELLHSMNVKRNLGDIKEQKHLKKQKNIESTVLNNNLNNDTSLDTNNDVHDNEDQNVPKSLSPIKFDGMCKLSSSLTGQYNNISQTSFAMVPPMVISLNSVSNCQAGHKSIPIEQQTLEPIQLKQELLVETIDGMTYSLLLYC